MKNIRLFFLLVVMVIVVECSVGCAALNEAGAYIAAVDMRKVIANTDELTPAEDIAAIYYNDVNHSEYLALNIALYELELQQGMTILRIFAVEGNKCFFVSEHEGSENYGKLFLYSIGINGKNCELIKTFDEGKYVFYDEFDGAFSGEVPDYPDVPAFYYQGRIVVNIPDTVYEYDIGSGQITEYDPAKYEYPQNEYELSYSNGGLLVEGNGESFQVTVQDLIDSSAEMKFLYDLSIEQYGEAAKENFLHYFIYYDAEPYIVCRPMSRYGFSFGALFKFEPDTRSVAYIDCVFTNDIPYCVYPMIIKN